MNYLGINCMSLKQYRNKLQLGVLLFETLVIEKEIIDIPLLAKKMKTADHTVEGVIELLMFIQKQPKLVVKPPGDDDHPYFRISLKKMVGIQDYQTQNITRDAFGNRLSSIQITYLIFDFLLQQFFQNTKPISLDKLRKFTKLNQPILVKYLDFIEYVQNQKDLILVHEQLLKKQIKLSSS